MKRITIIRRINTAKTACLLAGFALVVGAAAMPFVWRGTADAACSQPDTDRGTITSTVNIPEDATYRIWSRMKAPDDSRNTYYLEVDGDQCFLVGGSMTPNQWNWIDFRDNDTSSKTDIQLNSGSHTLKFIGNQDGVKLDRIIFASDHSCAPASQTGTECDIPEDTTPPQVSLTSPTPDSTITGNQKVSASASDNTGITKVEFYVNGNKRSTNVNAPYEFTLDTTQLEDGDSVLIARAYDAAGNTSADSYNVTVDNSEKQAPPPPEDVEAEETPDGNEVTWEPSPGADEYDVYRNDVPVATVDENKYTDKDVTPGEDYEYRVSAKDKSGLSSEPSEKATVQTDKVNDTDAPSEVRHLRARAVNAGQINLRWEASVDNVAVKFYDVYRSTGDDEPQKIGETASNSFGDAGLEASTEYSYFARARDASGNVGAPSDTVKVETKKARKKGVVYGSVKDGATNKVIRHALVVVTDRSGKKYIFTTSRQGEYLIRRLDPGSYSTSFRARGYKSAANSFRSLDDIIRKDAVLEKR